MRIVVVVHLPNTNDSVNHQELKSVVGAILALISFFDAVPVIWVIPTLRVRRVSDLSADIAIPIVVAGENV
jgi:hypothetical protein